MSRLMFNLEDYFYALSARAQVGAVALAWRGLSACCAFAGDMLNATGARPTLH